MREVFADTSGWANFFVRTQPFHMQAVQLMQKWYREQTKVITTNYILTELVALFTSPLRVPRPQLINSIETIQYSLWVEVVHIDRQLHQESWQFLQNRQDKNWSLVDCSSIIIMQKRGIELAFTSDHHFEQAGYQRSLVHYKP